MEALPNSAPGVLFFDPNPTTARLATAGLRLAGYVVHLAASQADAVALCRAHGSAGDNSIAVLVLDTASSPKVSAAVLQALVQVEGAAELPAVLLVSRANPTPFPGAEQLPTLRRPFTTPALLNALRQALDAQPRIRPSRGQHANNEALAQLEIALTTHFGDIKLTPQALEDFAATLVHVRTLPVLTAGIALHANLDATRVESLLAMLADEAARGVLELRRNDATARLHLAHGRIVMAEIEQAEDDLRLGRFVVEPGFVRSEALESIVRNQEAQLLGERLLEEQLLFPHELHRALLNQALEIVCHVTRWTEGRAVFSPASQSHPLVKAASSPAELLIVDALLEALRRAQARAEMGPHMPGLEEVYLRNDTEVARIGRSGFARSELDVLEQLNGRNSVKEVARKTRTGAFAVASILYRLGRARVVRRRLAPQTG